MNRTYFTKFKEKLPTSFATSRGLLLFSGVAAVLILITGFRIVHCTQNCGSIVRFQYFHYRNLLFAFIAIQSFGWYLHFEEGEGSTRWNIILSAILMLISFWVYGVVFQWDQLATFYFSRIAPYMVRFLLL